MLLMSGGVFANDIAEEKVDTTACCTRTSSSGQPGTVGYVSVTVTKCHGGRTREDAYSAACRNASSAAAAAVKSLEDSTVIIIPTN